MKKFISLFISVLIIFSVFSLAGCGQKEQGNQNEPKTNADESGFVDGESNPVATIEVEDYGVITVELYYDKAPNTVKNFISLANKGFYDGLIFHRIIENFMIQGGDPEGTGGGGPGYSIKGEFAGNGFEANDISHVRGVISMARATPPDSAGSQFFICRADSPHLDGSYAAFGMVTDGIEVVDKIAAVATSYGDRPLKDVVIKSITVDTHGISYDEPETIA